MSHELELDASRLYACGPDLESFEQWRAGKRGGARKVENPFVRGWKAGTKQNANLTKGPVRGKFEGGLLAVIC